MPQLPPNLVSAPGQTPADVVVIKTWQKSATTVSVVLKDSAGVAVSVPNGGSCVLQVKETPTLAPFVTKTFTNTSGAAVTTAVFSFGSSDFVYAGLCKAMLTVKDAGGSILKKTPCFVEVSPDGETSLDFEPLLIDNLRQQLLDRCPSDNSLLASVEFLDGEICTAICQAVDWWNEAQPMNSTDTTSYRAFQWTHHGTVGAMAYLYLNKARMLQRNRMALQGDGIGADDKARAEAYEAYGTKMLNDYRTWVGAQIVRLNYGKWAGSFQDPSFEPISMLVY